MKTPLLSVQKLNASYSSLQVINNISFEIFEGECVAILGRNGAGKSTLLKALMKSEQIQSTGDVFFKNITTNNLSTHKLAQRGISFCPDYRGILSSLSVEENFKLAKKLNPTKSFDDNRIFELFPFIQERKKNSGSQISGGEQQMLAIARVLRMGPDLLLLDEPTEGLAPLMRKSLSQTLQVLKKSGLSMLIVEQHIQQLKGLADRYYVLHLGKIVMSFSKNEFDKKIKEAEDYLSLKN